MNCAGANLVPCRGSVQALDQYILLAERYRQQLIESVLRGWDKMLIEHEAASRETTHQLGEELAEGDQGKAKGQKEKRVVQNRRFLDCCFLPIYT